jgi:hypothetical protein
VLARFPGAQIVDVRGHGDDGSAGLEIPGADTGPEPLPIDDAAGYGIDGTPDDTDDDR